MFDTAELGHRVGKGEFKERERALRARLLKLQYRALDEARFPILIDFAGVDGAGKVSTVNMLNKWMDPRWIRTVGYEEPTGEELGRPRFWRYWRDLPPRGQTGLYLSGRYSRSLVKRVYGELDEAAFDDRLAGIIRFENALVDDGALILKFWMHLSADAQKKRLETLSRDPLESYKVTKRDRRNRKRYDDFVAAAERIVTRTNRVGAPWTIVEGVDPNYRHLRVGEVVADALARRLNEDSGAGSDVNAGSEVNAAADVNAGTDVAAGSGGEAVAADSVRKRTIFDTLDLGKSETKGRYKSQKKKRQAKLGELGRRARERGLSTVLVFEGMDAAGKGGAIRRTVWSLDARHYRVHQFAAPTEVERRYHYLWRFWRRLPPAGHVAVFDRSWYGRVLVERTEGFAAEAEWRRAYNEINDFERQLVGRGIVLLKFWLHIDPEEQLRRFEERADSAFKHWKLTDEDWRNRAQWDAYGRAAHDMIQFTSTHDAPWILVEGNSKHFARLKVLKAVCDRLEQALG